MKRRLWLVALMCLTPMVLAPHATAMDGAEYVALGDSGAATTGVQHLDTGAPLICARTTANTPKLIAQDLGLRLDDRTCSSAKIKDLTSSQGAGVAPQFDALGPNTRLVTVHIGANDTNISRHILTCHTGGAQPCGDPAWDRDIDAIADTYSAALHRISELAPNARIIVDGWPLYVRDGGCPELVGLRPADAATVQRAFDRLNTVVAAGAAANRATYVDTRAGSVGHDMCAPEGVRWFDPILATETLVPYHPTPAGMRGIADIIMAAIRAN
ncbi:SGNH/GDSL hydrolase family protein [Nocardia sp. NPDC127579]|uniref:SGNH/GDSL hydrolase family protein n=1 Tax=Nocardia sp. NPDC127579 TaxID=3345402 RepID=UPI003630A55E